MRAVSVLAVPVLFAAGLVLATQAGAQSTALPVPAEIYRDKDPAAVMPEEVPLGDNRAYRQLEQILAYSPRHVPARVQHGFHLVARGLNTRAQQEFEYAIRVADEGSLNMRHAHWGYGWGLFRMGEYRRAIEEWMEAERLHGGTPTWAPWTYAIGLWMAGDRELALEFWESAVRSDPERWGSSRGLEREIRGWFPNQRLAAEALHAEWKRRLTEQ